MNYEKIPHDKNKSIKLSYSDIEAVQWLYHVEKWTKQQISSRFNVSLSCINYHLMTDEEKKERNRQCNEINKNRIKRDEKYRKHLLANGSMWAKKNKKVRSDFNDWRNEMSQKQRDKENSKTWAHDYRIKHHDIITTKAKVYNAKPEVKSHKRIKNLERYKQIKNDPILHERYKQMFNQWRKTPKAIELIKKYESSDRRKELRKMQSLERTEREKRDPYFNL